MDLGIFLNPQTSKTPNLMVLKLSRSETESLLYVLSSKLCFVFFFFAAYPSCKMPLCCFLSAGKKQMLYMRKMFSAAPSTSQVPEETSNPNVMFKSTLLCGEAQGASQWALCWSLTQHFAFDCFFIGSLKHFPEYCF